VTAVTAPPAAPSTRIARRYGTCLNCTYGIRPGHHIVKQPGRAWQHADCARPRPMRRTAR
jgi:hypothetical protein